MLGIERWIFALCSELSLGSVTLETLENEVYSHEPPSGRLEQNKPRS